jgi:DMSO/TMAO reductase YedYZ molybdopterin-dependent catalytic subunit
MSHINRRRFIRLALGGVSLYILSSCIPGEKHQAAVTETPSATETPGAQRAVAPTPTPTPAPSPVILRNENRPGFFIRYYKPFEAVDPDHWTIVVEGLVKKPQELTLLDIQSLPSVSQVSRMKCVEGWSAAAKWGGFHLSSLLKLVEPQPEAKWVQFYCADGYYESLTLEELLAERVLFVYRMNDKLLPDVHGSPLRLIVPPKYGYKGPKAITRLVFAEKELPGYWPTEGPYSTDGYIQPGRDYPLDIGESRQVKGGEVIYPDGLESRQE